MANVHLYLLELELLLSHNSCRSFVEGDPTLPVQPLNLKVSEKEKKYWREPQLLKPLWLIFLFRQMTWALTWRVITRILWWHLPAGCGPSLGSGHHTIPCDTIPCYTNSLDSGGHSLSLSTANHSSGIVTNITLLLVPFHQVCLYFVPCTCFL